MRTAPRRCLAVAALLLLAPLGRAALDPAAATRGGPARPLSGGGTRLPPRHRRRAALGARCLPAPAARLAGEAADGAGAARGSLVPGARGAGDAGRGSHRAHPRRPARRRCAQGRGRAGRHAGALGERCLPGAGRAGGTVHGGLRRAHERARRGARHARLAFHRPLRLRRRRAILHRLRPAATGARRPGRAADRALCRAAAVRASARVPAVATRSPTPTSCSAACPARSGLKTGYTARARQCLIAVAERDGRRVWLVMLGGEQRWWLAHRMISNAFDVAAVEAR